ncbi:MAG: hypothetical protein JRH05_12355, partial [Deltaproteobacteria bacterium]|nr:hypothetical protein [Deltaproteobacteria bacterium]
SLCFLHGVGGLCFSQEFCVSTPVKLQAALDAAAVNNEADTIDIVQGTYTGNFTYHSNQGHGITLRGGYTQGCTTRVVSAADTSN